MQSNWPPTPRDEAHWVAAWDCARPYVRALIAAVRLQGLHIELTDLILLDSGDCDAVWLLITATGRKVTIFSGGTVEMQDWWLGPDVQVQEKTHRVQVNADSWAFIARHILQPSLTVTGRADPPVRINMALHNQHMTDALKQVQVDLAKMENEAALRMYNVIDVRTTQHVMCRCYPGAVA